MPYIKNSFVISITFIIFMIFTFKCDSGKKNDQKIKGSYDKVNFEVFTFQSKRSIFFVLGDSIYQYNYSSGYYNTSISRGGYNIKFLPLSWENHGRSFTSDILKKQNIILDRSIIVKPDLNFSGPIQAHVLFGNQTEMIEIMNLSVHGHGFDEYTVLGITDFTALYYYSPKKIIKLNNERFFKVKQFVFNTASNNSLSLIDIKDKEQINVKLDSGTQVKLSVLDFNNIDFYCFGGNGLKNLADDLKKVPYKTKYPFLYVFKKLTSVDKNQ